MLKTNFYLSDGDPNNYLTYYRRATVYLALGKSKSALPDLDMVVKLKPDFTSVRSKMLCWDFIFVCFRRDYSVEM